MHPSPPHPEFLIGLRRAAKEGLLSADQLQTLIGANATPSDRVSRLRFALRLQRWLEQGNGTWPLDLDIEREIGLIYRDQSEHADTPIDQLRWAWWARRYGVEDFDWGDLERSFRASIATLQTPRDVLRAICEADLGLAFDPRTGHPRTHFLRDHPSMEILRPVGRLVSSRRLLRQSSATVCLEFGPWSLALRTDEGPKLPNQDGALFAAFSDDSFLAAVADGTGDSPNGARAAEVALQTLAGALAATGDLPVSVELAAASLRADNICRREENACTLVAIHIRNDNAILIHLSDPFHWLQADGEPPRWSRLNRNARFNVGGERFGYTLTSSGSVVGTFVSFTSAREGVEEVDGLRCFVIGSDGLLAVPDEAASGEECPVTIDVDESRRNPYVIASSCHDIALQAMTEGRRSGDNITCVTGFRCR